MMAATETRATPHTARRGLGRQRGRRRPGRPRDDYASCVLGCAAPWSCLRATGGSTASQPASQPMPQGQPSLCLFFGGHESAAFPLPLASFTRRAAATRARLDLHFPPENKRAPNVCLRVSGRAQDFRRRQTDSQAPHPILMGNVGVRPGKSHQDVTLLGMIGFITHTSSLGFVRYGSTPADIGGMDCLYAENTNLRRHVSCTRRRISTVKNRNQAPVLARLLFSRDAVCVLGPTGAGASSHVARDWPRCPRFTAA